MMNKPLEGHTFFVTRSVDDYQNTAALIQQRGGEPVACPMISFRLPKKELPKLDDCILHINRYDWLLLTSSNGVEFFYKRFTELNQSISILSNLQCAVIGKKTNETAKAYGIQYDFMPCNANAEAFFDEFKETYEIKGKSFLFPTSQIAHETLPGLLKEHGGYVDQVVAYYTEHTQQYDDSIVELLNENKTYWVLFTSSSTVDAFMTCMKHTDNISAKLLFASIGPSTSKTIRDHGHEPAVEANEHTMEGLLHSIAEYLFHNN